MTDLFEYRMWVINNSFNINLNNIYRKFEKGDMGLLYELIDLGADIGSILQRNSSDYKNISDKQWNEMKETIEKLYSRAITEVMKLLKL